MEHIEESHAQDLHHDLTRRFADSVPATVMTIDGAGVHWDCTAKRGRNTCSIACFNVSGPEYLTSFQRESETIAIGRTSSKQDTINAVDDWLQGQKLPKMYDRFGFIDQAKRALASIRDDMLARVPELTGAAPSELQHDMGDVYCLWFRGVDRSCKISYNVEKAHSEAFFYWDQCALFWFKTEDRERLAAVAQRWLCNRAMPSALRSEFPWIQIGELADYYERGDPIGGEFHQSWNDIERFYDKWHYPVIPKIISFIMHMRKNGHDKSLRAGQSLWSLIVSRSRRHGLTENQPRIVFTFGDDGMEVHANFGNHPKVRYPSIEFTPELEALLKELEEKDID